MKKSICITLMLCALVVAGLLWKPAVAKPSLVSEKVAKAIQKTTASQKKTISVKVPGYSKYGLENSVYIFQCERGTTNYGDNYLFCQQKDKKGPNHNDHLYMFFKTKPVLLDDRGFTYHYGLRLSDNMGLGWTIDYLANEPDEDTDLWLECRWRLANEVFGGQPDDRPEDAGELLPTFQELCKQAKDILGPAQQKK